MLSLCRKRIISFVFLNTFRKLYSENFTGKKAQYSGKKSDIDEVKIMTLSIANF